MDRDGLTSVVAPYHGLGALTSVPRGRTPAQAAAVLGVPVGAPLDPHVVTFGQYMLRQESRLREGALGVRTFAAAWLVTAASQNRQATREALLRARAARFTADADPECAFQYEERVGEATLLVRPETAMARLLRCGAGQSFLDGVERGVLRGPAARRLADAFRPFGDVGLPEGAGDFDPLQRRKVGTGVTAFTRLVGLSAVMESIATTAAAKWPVFQRLLAEHDSDGLVRFAAQSDPRRRLYGVGPGKIGFIAALLGYGGIPTFDAREIALWWPGTRGLDATPARIRSLAQKLFGLRIEVPAGMQPHYQHLAHHMVWDRAGARGGPATATTHADIVKLLENT